MSKEKDENYYVKLPNILFYENTQEKEEGKKSILKTVGDSKVVLILRHLVIYSNVRGYTFFSLEHLIVSCGYKPNRNKGKMNDIFKRILNKLKTIGILECDINLLKISFKEIVTCKLNLHQQNEDGDDIKFVQIYDSAKDKIYNYNKEIIDKAELFTYYCYLICRMYKRSEAEGSIEINGGRPEICFPSYNIINYDVSITESTIKKYNDILVELKLIGIGKVGRMYKKASVSKVALECPNIYGMYRGNDYSTQYHIKEGIEYFKKLNEDEYVFVGNKYKNDRRSIGGTIGAISRWEKEGRTTQKNIDRKNKLEQELKTIDNNKNFDLKVLFENSEYNRLECLASEIYEEESYKYESEKFNYFQNISCKMHWLESELGLIGSDECLTVDYSYYKWIMLNYKSKEHQYYKNCVDKHIREANRNMKKGNIKVI